MPEQGRASPPVVTVARFARRMVLRQHLRSRRRSSAADRPREPERRHPRHRQSGPLLRPRCPSCGRRNRSGARQGMADRWRSPRRRGRNGDAGCCPGVELLPHPVYQRPAPRGEGRRGSTATTDLPLTSWQRRAPWPAGGDRDPRAAGRGIRLGLNRHNTLARRGASLSLECVSVNEPLTDTIAAQHRGWRLAAGRDRAVAV